MDRQALLAGLIDIADERMADAIRGISLRRGYDPSEYALVAFGGAGAQHACGVASRLGIGTVIVPTDAGLLSALGIGHAPLERFAERQVLRRAGRGGGSTSPRPSTPSPPKRPTPSRARACRATEIAIRRRIANLRYVGQDSTLTIEWDRSVALRDAFEARYAAVYGHRPASRPIEVESVRAIASTHDAEAPAPPRPIRTTPPPPAPARRGSAAPGRRSPSTSATAWSPAPASPAPR